VASPTRWLALAAGFAAGFGLTGAACLLGAERAALPYVTAPLDLLPSLRERFALARERRAARRLVLFLGDSLAIDPRGEDTSVPEALRARLRADPDAEGSVELASLAGPALSLYSHYFLADCALALRPDLVVLELNPRTFAPAWLADDRAELAGWLPARRWGEALALPLHAVDVHPDGLFFRGALVAAGGAEAWRRLQREQVRLAFAPEAAARFAQEHLGGGEGLAYAVQHQQASLRREKTAANRATADHARALLGPLLAGLAPGDPGLAVLDALLARLEQSGVAAVAYLAPTNVEHLASLGLYSPRGPARSAARIDAVARRRGASFLDLHALLPDAAFHDHLDHLVQGVPGEGSGAVAAALAPLLQARLREAPGPRAQAPSRCPDAL
jgi:hypothetical protein